jgi:CRP-like cAMP-binding protein
VTQDGRRLRTLGAGDHFGELALLLDVPRTATVRAVTPTRLFRVDRDAFDQLVRRAFDRPGAGMPSRVVRVEEH